MSSALQTATGSTHQLLTANPSFNLTGLYHMYVYGNTCKSNFAAGVVQIFLSFNSHLKSLL